MARIPAQGRAFHRGALLLRAISRSTSPNGLRLKNELAQLYETHERLLHAVGAVPLMPLEPLLLNSVLGTVTEPAETLYRKRDRHLGLRRSSRTYTNRYLEEADGFCSRWRLRAPWALPSIACAHLVRAVTGLEELTSVVLFGGGWIPSIETTVELPLEREGQPLVRRYRVWQDEPAPLGLAQAEFEDTLDRPLKKRERRSVQGQLDEPKVRLAREASERPGWEITGSADLLLPARWCAIKLLDPRTSYADIARSDLLDDRGDRAPDTIRKAVAAFARQAELTLP